MMKAPGPAASMEQTANLHPSLSAGHFCFAGFTAFISFLTSSQREKYGVHRKVFTPSLCYSHFAMCYYGIAAAVRNLVCQEIQNKILAGIETCSAFVYNVLITRKP